MLPDPLSTPPPDWWPKLVAGCLAGALVLLCLTLAGAGW